MGVYQTTGSGAYTMEGLVRFGNLGIPAGVTVSSAKLTLSVDTWDANPTIRGYYVLAPWSAAPGASAGQIGWLHRGNGGDWVTPGALGQGSDVVAGKSFVLSGIRAVGAQSITIDLDPAVIQGWIDNPGADQGILLVNESAGKIVRINASENATASLRPKLSVTYGGSATPQPGALQFSSATYSVNENGGATTITVTRSGGSDGSVAVNYATSNGTAAAGSDYTASSGTLTFAAGETSKTFTVPITNDALVEGAETINLTLSGPTGGATLGGQATATLTIQDDDVAPQPGALRFSASAFSVDEGQATATITVTRTGGSDGSVSVNYATSNGSATAGSDYTGASGTLTFAAGQTSKTFTVPILNDTAVEGAETVNLTLSGPTGGATLGSPAAATLTIVDNDTPPPSGAFTNINAASGIDAIVNQMYQTNPDWWLSGEHLVDLDNDGALDLFLDSHGGGNAIAALNDGHGHFTRVTSGSFPTTEIHEMVDINGDGKVDLSATFQDGGGQWWINNSTPGHVNFTPTSVTRGTNTSRSQVLFDFNGDGKVDWFRSAPPGLVVDFGDGNGGFTEGSLSFVIAGTDSNDNASFLPADFDGDGKTDLLVLVGGNYDGTPGKTLYWHNNGNLTFTDMTASAGIPANGTIAKGIGDFDQDGDVDFIAIQNKSMPPVIYLNDGHGHFTVKPNAISGVAAGSLDYTSWGTAITTDVDNDGILDIIMDGKYYLKVLRGTGGGNFTYMNDTWGIKDTAAMSVDDGVAFGDIDGDGDIDMIGYNQTFPTRTLNVYRNDVAQGNWLNVRPVGLPGDAGAAGAKISIFAAGTNQLLWFEQIAQYDFQVATSYYGYGQTERHFGLGSRTTVDVVVEWPDGRVTRLNGVAANQTLQVVESAN
ncbi:MAG: Calx-beta domain-containing protein [Gemmataceae bacterium]